VQRRDGAPGAGDSASRGHGSVLMPGEPASVAIYTVLGSHRRRVPLSLRERRAWNPFVGRRELTLLHALLRQARESCGQVVGVMGEPGLGKSQLVAEFQRCLRGQPFTYLAANCVSHGTASPYLPILALLRQHCGLTKGDTLATPTAKVRASLQAVGLAPEEGAPYLLHLLGIPSGVEGGAGLSPEGSGRAPSMSWCSWPSTGSGDGH
jgi:predicted ATPase